MNIFNATYYLLTCLSLITLLWMRSERWALALFAVALALQLLIGGYSWQLLPVYLLLIIPLLLVLWSSAPQWLVGSAIVIVIAGFSLSVGLRYLLPNFAFPSPTGPHEVGITEWRSADGVEARIWYPASPGDSDRARPYLAEFDRPLFGLPPILYSHLKGRSTFAFQDAQPLQRDAHPVIVYEHSADGHAAENTFLLTDLASHGFVVVAVVHRNTLAEYELDLAALSAQPEALLDAMETVMADRGEELGLLIDELATLNQSDALLKGRLDVTQFAFLGYSLGGGIVADYCAIHKRCRAVVNLDGNPFAVAHHTGLTAPYLHVSQHVVFNMVQENGSSSATAQMADLYKREVSQVVAQTVDNGHAANWLLLRDSGHASFTDLAYWVTPRWGPLQPLFGTVNTEQSQAAIREVVRAFLQEPTSVEPTVERHSLLSEFSK